MSSYLINLPEISDRHNAFDIVYNLLERNPIIKKLKACPHSFLMKIRRKKLPSDLLIHVLKNNLKRSDWFRQSHLKEFEQPSSLSQIFPKHQFLI